MCPTRFAGEFTKDGSPKKFSFDHSLWSHDSVHTQMNDPGRGVHGGVCVGGLVLERGWLERGQSVTRVMPHHASHFGGRVGSAHAASTFVQRGKSLLHKFPFLFYPHSPFACGTCGVCGRGTSTFSLRSKCIRVWEPRFSKTPCKGTMHVSSHTVSPATLSCFCSLVVYFCNP